MNHRLYFITAALVFGLSFITGETSFDIAVHDRYLLLGYGTILKLIALLFFSYGLINRLRFAQILPKYVLLVPIHLGVSIVTLGAIWFTAIKSNERPIYSDYSVYQNYLEDTGSNMNWMVIWLIVFIFAQFIFLLNLVRTKNLKD